MKAKPIKDVMQRIIDDRRAQLEKERDKYRQKMHDTQYYYGCGGPYMRQEAAMEKREKELDELKRFEYQLRHTVKTKVVGLYVMGCRHCHSVFFSTQSPFNDWHECPACRGMNFITQVPRQDVEIVMDGSGWQEMLKAAVEGEDLG